MKAAVFHERGRPLSIETVSDPAPGPEELVLRVRNAGICGSDLHLVEREGGVPKGTVMGHEFAGEVVAVGRDAAGWREGERVCALPMICCGRCAACLTGDGVHCETFKDIGVGGVPGSYAEFVRVSAYETLRLPEAVDFRTGAIVEPLAVGLHGVNRAGLQRGENVLVIGAGPIGLATALWARFFGARHVVVSERVPGRLELAARFGATGSIDASQADVRQAFKAMTGGPPDVIFECVGVPGVLNECLRIAGINGRIVVIGVCMHPDTVTPLRGIVKELQLSFCYYYRRQDFQFTLDMLGAGRIAPQPMITDVVGFDRFAQVFEALKTPSDQCKVQLGL